MTLIPMKPARRGELKNHIKETLQQVGSVHLFPASLLAHTPSLRHHRGFLLPSLEERLADAKVNTESKSVSVHGEAKVNHRVLLFLNLPLIA